MGENDNNSGVGLKVALYIAVGLFIATAAYTVHLYSSGNKIQGQLKTQKQAVVDSLTAMTKRYDVMIGENEIVNEDLASAKQRVQGLLDSLKIAEINVNTLMKYKSKSQSLQRQLFRMVRQNDSLRAENMILGYTLDSTNVALDERKKFSDSLVVKTDALKEVVQNATVLSATALNAYGIIQRSSGKEIPSDKASRIDKIRICFSIAKNRLVKNGDKKLYIQVLNPAGDILGENVFFEGKEETFTYSLVTNFNYEGTNLDICEYEISPTGVFDVGTYTVHIYNKIGLVAESEFTLR